MAADYVLIPKSLREPFVKLLRVSIKTLYESEGKTVEESPDYGRIVNAKHFDRLNEMVRDAQAKGAHIAIGGSTNPADNYIEPTVLTGVTAQMMVMEDEVFGPVLPIMDYEDLDEALAFVNELPKPLALYAFSKSKKQLDHIFNATSSGGAVANDCVLQFVHPELPFGGVNNSGIGKAHGHSGFLEFSNQKSVLRQRIGHTAAGLVFPPINKTKRFIIDIILKWL